MIKIFYPTAEKLQFLLQLIHNRELALPDFQRDFVWDPRATEELIESICQNFPAGSLLRIKNTTGFYFTPREFSGAPPLDGHEPTYLVLDGQQRLTSLYQAFFGVGTHRYFIDLQGLIDEQDLEDCVFYLRRKEARKRYGDLAKQAATLVFPLERLFGSSDGFEGWVEEVLECRHETEAEKKSLRQKLREEQKRWLRTVEEYEFPMVTLSESTTASAVCTIFETLNRTGVKLTVFDLLSARFWSESLRLRDLWERARDEYPILEEFDIDPYYILQAIAIFAPRGAPSCKRKDVLELDADKVRLGWDPVVRGLDFSMTLLRQECGVLVPEWLPYNTILVPLAAVAATHLDRKGPEVAALKLKLQRWFWCSVFMQAYEKAPNSQAVKDAAELRRWISGGEPPEAVVRFRFDSSLLRQTTPRQRAIYRGVMALILRNKARDFHEATPLDAAMIAEKQIDDHHVFPRGFFEAAGIAVDPTLRDCVLNRTLIDKKTNIRIGKKAPSIYLQEIAQAVPANLLDSILDSHLLPVEPMSALRQDRFEEFLDEREAIVRAQMEAVTG